MLAACARQASARVNHPDVFDSGRHGDSFTDVRRSGRLVVAEAAPVLLTRRAYFAGREVSQGVGFHLEPSGSRLKCELVMKGWFRYLGSSTMVVTVNHSVP